MHSHMADALEHPQLVGLGNNLVVARFEAMKVASALHAVEQLLRMGTIQRGDTLVDSSSGLYAYSLALACHKHGLRCHIVASASVHRSLRLQLQLLGARVEFSAGADSLRQDQNLRVERIEQILAENPHFHWMRQYHDPIHYSGYAPLARRIHEAVGPGPLSLVGGVGSGCSTGALAVHLRKLRDDVELIGVQPFGSVTFGSEHIEDQAVRIAGIGSAIPFDNVHHELYDVVHWVGFDHGCAGATALMRTHAIFAGLSSGCSYLAARWEARRQPARQYLFLAADTGERYVDSVFARHADWPDIQALQPWLIDDASCMRAPWSRMHWGRRPAE